LELAQFSGIGKHIVKLQDSVECVKAAARQIDFKRNTVAATPKTKPQKAGVAVSTKRSAHAKPPLSIESAENEASRGNASSLTKMLSILDLFSSDTPIWSTVEIIDALETSRSTGYRYIKALNASGLLTAVGNGFYILGPRIIELDLQIRNTDPLLQASKGVLEQLVDITGHSALLCMLFRNSVLCIREHLAPLSPQNLFSRGQRRPLLRGAISKVILANLPNHRLRGIFNRNQHAITEANLGSSWEEFRDALSKIRRDGIVVTEGEFNPGIIGIAAPIFNSEQAILGSVGIALSKEERKDIDMNKAIVSVKRAAREISHRMANTLSRMDLPPRAVG
jgi:DNA-binding IclR family transcriptional regulator